MSKKETEVISLLDDYDDEVEEEDFKKNVQYNNNNKATSSSSSLQMDEIFRLFLTCAYSALGIDLVNKNGKKAKQQQRQQHLKRTEKQKRKPKRRTREDDDEDEEDDEEEEESDEQIEADHNSEIAIFTWVEDELESMRTLACQNYEQELRKTKTKNETAKIINGLWSWKLDELKNKNNSNNKNKKAEQEKSVEELTRLVSDGNKVSDLTLTQQDYQSWINAFSQWLKENIVNTDNEGKQKKTNKKKNEAEEESSNNSQFETRAQILMMTMMQVSYEDVKVASLQHCVDAIVGCIFCVVDPNDKHRALLPKPEVLEIDDE